MAQKTDLLASIQFAYDEILAFAGGLGEAERTTPGLVDRWAAHDVLAHVGYSVQRSNETLPLRLRGEEPPPGLNNDETYHRYKTASWEDIRTTIRQAFETKLEQVRDLSDERLNTEAEWLNGQPLWRGITGSAFLHPLIHLIQTLIERGEYEKALQLNERAVAMGERLDTSPGWLGTFTYNTGCYYALMGKKQPALEHLEQGLRMAPNLVPFAREDTDLVSLQNDADFQAMLDRFPTPG